MMIHWHIVDDAQVDAMVAPGCKPHRAAECVLTHRRFVFSFDPQVDSHSFCTYALLSRWLDPIRPLGVAASRQVETGL